MVNKVIIIGNLGRSAETRTLDSGNKVAKFSVATNENYKDRSGEWQTQTEWHDVVAWGKLADKAETLEKGQMIYVEGKLMHRKWEDKDGNPRKTTEIVANYFRVIAKREEGQGAPVNSAPEGRAVPTDPVAPSVADGDDEYPF